MEKDVGRVENSSVNTSAITASANGTVGGTANATVIELSQGRIRAWRRWLVVLTLVFSDALLAVLVWGVALEGRNLWGSVEIWGSGEILGVTLASTASS